MTPPETPGASGTGDLKPGTEQRSQLRTRIADIAWTALCVVLALWAVWTSFGVAEEDVAWSHGVAAWTLLALALVLRFSFQRRRQPHWGSV